MTQGIQIPFRKNWMPNQVRHKVKSPLGIGSTLMAHPTPSVLLRHAHTFMHVVHVVQNQQC